jgi:2-oxoglutarate ferredoxin oxidoreductase subunit alpha
MVDEYRMDDAEICIFAVGSVARSARQAVKMLRQRNVRAGLMRPQIVWPFPKQAVEEMLDRVELVLVPEMNVGQLRKEVERLARSSRTPVKGLNVLNPTMISAEQIIGRLRALGAIAESSLEGVRQHG